MNLGCEVGSGVVICISGGFQAAIVVEIDAKVVERGRGVFESFITEAVVGVVQAALANG